VAQRLIRAAFVVYMKNPYKRTQLAYYKLGDGPSTSFIAVSPAAHPVAVHPSPALSFHADPTVAPLAGPSCEVVTMAKRHLKAGERSTAWGGYCAYGLIENHAAARAKQCASDRNVGRLRAAAGRWERRGRHVQTT